MFGLVLVLMQIIAGGKFLLLQNGLRFLSEDLVYTKTLGKGFCTVDDCLVIGTMFGTISQILVADFLMLGIRKTLLLN